MIDLKNILNQVQAVQKKNIEDEVNKGFKEDERVLTLNKGGKYTIRLIPHVDKEGSAKNTIITYKECGLTSKSTGKFIYLGRSPTDAGITGKDDLIQTAQWDAYKAANKDKALEKDARQLMASTRKAINGYLVAVEGDDDAKDKIGKVVVVKYPARLDYTDKKNPVPSSRIFKLIESALSGEKSKVIGTRLLDLSDKGMSLIIKVTEKGGYKNYDDSEIDYATDLELTKEDQEKIYSQAHDLKEFIPEVKTKEEIKKLLDEHWFCTSASPEDELEEDEKPEEDEDEIPDLKVAKTSKTKKISKEIDLDELLKDDD